LGAGGGLVRLFKGKSKKLLLVTFLYKILTGKNYFSEVNILKGKKASVS